MAVKVRDVMSRDVLTASPHMRLRDAAEVMRSWDIGSLPVCEDRKVVGIVTDRDITVRGTAEGMDPATTRIEEVMTRDIIMVREDADLDEAGRIMGQWQLRRLPVLNAKNELVGYLSMAKIVRQEGPAEAGKVIQEVSRPSHGGPETDRRGWDRRRTG